MENEKLQNKVIQLTITHVLITKFLGFSAIHSNGI
jgi:hypothetical protein